MEQTMGQSDFELHAVGRSLANELRGYARRPDTVVLALAPRVVPLAAKVAAILGAPLDLFLVRALRLPGAGRLEIGAVASGGMLILDPGAVKAHAIPASTIAPVAQAAAQELARREQAYRDEQEPLDLRDRGVVVVDDGRSDRSTLRVAITALRRRWVARVVLASPALPAGVCRELLTEADEIVAALTQEPVPSDRSWTEDDAGASATEVAGLLQRAGSPALAAAATSLTEAEAWPRS
jgi:predicted phosphoribosyltransferase